MKKLRPRRVKGLPKIIQPVRAMLGGQQRFTRHPSPIPHVPGFRDIPQAASSPRTAGVGWALRLVLGQQDKQSPRRCGAGGGKEKKGPQPCGRTGNSQPGPSQNGNSLLASTGKWNNLTKVKHLAHSRHSADSRHIYSCHCCCW